MSQPHTPSAPSSASRSTPATTAPGTPEPHPKLPSDASATRFWWIRHALVPEAHHQMYGDLDLDCDTSDSALFRGVAEQLPVDALWFTSELKRTHQTAEALIAAGATPAGRHQHADIREMAFGRLNGMRLSDLHDERDDPFIGFWPWTPHESAPDGESFAALTTRVSEFVEQMHAEHAGRDLVCVAHRGTILAALRQALQTPLGTSVSFRIDNVSVTQIWRYADVPEGGPQFRIGQVGWLPSLSHVSPQ